MNDMKFEEFRQLRREVFLRGVYGLVLLVVIIALLMIMAVGPVSNSNLYEFRTVSFIIGLAYVSYVMALARKVAPVQREHPEWIEKTSIKSGPIELPAVWNRQRLIVITVAIVAVVGSFIGYL